MSRSSPPPSGRLSALLRGARHALPIVCGYAPVGFAFGVLAAQAGLSSATVGLMACFVYAGSAQFIAADLLVQGAGTASIVLTTCIVNLRHLLMSAALAPYVKTWGRPVQAWFCFEMTDETFAANMGRFTSFGVNREAALGLNGAAHLTWIACCLAGSRMDASLDIASFGLDFALPGMFIALLLPHARIPRRLPAIFLGGALSLSLALAGAGQWNVILAATAAATLAAFLPRRDNGAARAERP